MTTLALDTRLAFPGFQLSVTHEFALSGITALFGQSGSGKSTLLRIIAGLEPGASGHVRFASEAWQDAATFVAPHARGVGYVFQDTRLFSHLSAGGNLHYAAKRAPAGNAGAGFDQVVEALDLAPLLARSTGKLSGGERQRIAIARALLTRPRLLLMDEPLAALDPRRKAEIIAYIARIAGISSVPIIYVTHAIDEVIQLAGSMVLMSKGKVRAHGAVADVLERLDLQPDTGRFEAGAALAGQIAGHDDKFKLSRITVCNQIIEMPGVQLPQGAPIRIRVRARDVSVAIVRPTGLSTRNILSGHVVEIALEPDTAFAEMSIDIGGQRIRARLTRAAVADLKLAPGIAVFALIKSIVFDRRVLPGARQTPLPESDQND